MASFLFRFGNRHFLLFKLVSQRVIIHVYSGIRKKKMLIYKKINVLAVSDVVKSLFHEGEPIIAGANKLVALK